MPKVLLADDSITIHKVASLILKGTPYKLFTAESSAEAELVALREKPDIALIDLTLGASSGLQVIEKFSKHPELKQIQMALLYGHFQPIDEATVQEVGARAKLSKPFEAKDFLHLLETLINQRSKIPTVPEGLWDEKEITSSTTEDPFHMLFEEEEVDQCLNYLEKPLSQIKQNVTPVPSVKSVNAVLRASDSSPLSSLAVHYPSNDMVEKICREIIPPLAERIIREEIQKLLKDNE